MCKWLIDEASLELRQIDSVKFVALVAGLGSDYEEKFWLTFHKLFEG